MCTCEPSLQGGNKYGSAARLWCRYRCDAVSGLYQQYNGYIPIHFQHVYSRQWWRSVVSPGCSVKVWTVLGGSRCESDGKAFWDSPNLNDGMLSDVHTWISFKVMYMYYLHQVCEHALLERNVQCRKAMGHIVRDCVNYESIVAVSTLQSFNAHFWPTWLVLSRVNKLFLDMKKWMGDSCNPGNVYTVY